MACAVHSSIQFWLALHELLTEEGIRGIQAFFFSYSIQMYSLFYTDVQQKKIL